MEPALTAVRLPLCLLVPPRRRGGGCSASPRPSPRAVRDGMSLAATVRVSSPDGGRGLRRRSQAQGVRLVTGKKEKEAPATDLDEGRAP